MIERVDKQEKAEAAEVLAEEAEVRQKRPPERSKRR